MLWPVDELFLTSHFNTIRVLVIQFLLLSVCIGQSELIGPSVIAKLGGEAILPCHLESPSDATLFTVEWTRTDLNPRFVYVWRDGQELLGKKHKLFEGRTSLLINELKHGNVSLKISKVRTSDEGTYRCFIPSQEKQSLIQLITASDDICSPVASVAGIDKDKRGVVLQCQSGGWYPEPEVLWLDSEGNLLSAGPTETIRGPDGLYTVSSRVIVEKKNNNSFTCRVQQKNINQTRERCIYVPDDLFVFPSWPLPMVVALAFTSTICILLISAGSIFAWKWRENLNLCAKADEKENGNNKNKTHKEEQAPMIEETLEELLRTKEELKKSETMVSELQQELQKLTSEKIELQRQLQEQQDAERSWFSRLFWSSSNQQRKEEASKEEINQDVVEMKWKKLTEELEEKRKELETKTSALEQTKRHLDEVLEENRKLKDEKQLLGNSVKKK